MRGGFLKLCLRPLHALEESCLGDDRQDSPESNPLKAFDEFCNLDPEETDFFPSSAEQQLVAAIGFLTQTGLWVQSVASRQRGRNAIRLRRCW